MNENIGGVHMDSSYDNVYFFVFDVKWKITGIYYSGEVDKCLLYLPHHRLFNIWKFGDKLSQIERREVMILFYSILIENTHSWYDLFWWFLIMFWLFLEIPVQMHWIFHIPEIFTFVGLFFIALTIDYCWIVKCIRILYKTKAQD